MGLTLYIVNKDRAFENEIISNHILELTETNLVEYFIDGDGEKYVNTLPKSAKLHVFACDEEMPSLVNKNLYDERLTYCFSEDFKNIPKDLLKNEKENKEIIKMVKHLKNKVVILYWT
jgi:hypothetical protein